ncbi:hypothetical protein [Micromonospora sp. WMMD1082]|uniref:hypothetical protein n=1 Tax=Micromonospora sp. WMMD1082 TaxID=3016104 RepID=UPI0024179D3C|nr:hypothetical protein [Micromonospora sp. WMMD1082]MDG4797344.1 hypothetical protein [Micromonospora sp. WMMD1082]
MTDDPKVPDESRPASAASRETSELGALDDPERAVEREIEVVAERFPDTDVTAVEAAVRQVVAELRAEAEVETHVLALARHRVYDRLIEQGYDFQPGTDSSAESPAGPGPGDIGRAPEQVMPRGRSDTRG